MPSRLLLALFACFAAGWACAQPADGANLQRQHHVDPRERLGARGTNVDAANWQHYKERFLAPEGRIIDTGNKNISHSEGQGVGMLLAVANDDRQAFERIWDWTRRNLGLRDDGLFVWRWDPASMDKTPDKNSATDGDLVIAWAMARAGAHWREARYTETARGLAQAIRSRVVADIAGETLLLPGLRWPVQPDMTVLNLSYWIFPALQELSQLDSSPQWERVLRSGFRLLERARFGAWELPPDWMAMRHNGRLIPSDEFQFIFGYEAVRLPLHLIWADYQRKDLLRVYQAFWSATAKGSQIATMLSLNTDRILQQENVLGFRAVNDLVNCAMTGRPSQLLAGGFADYDDYYSVTLFLLTVRAAAERIPHCRGDSALAVRPVVCAEGAADRPSCPLANPIADGIRRAPVNIRLADVAQLPSNKARRPLARVSAVTHAGDGSGRLFVALREGQVHIVKDGGLLPEPLLDLVTLRAGAFIAPGGELGLAAIAFHPEFGQREKPAAGRLYTLHAERPESGGTPVLAGRSGKVHHHSVLVEWRVSAAQPGRVDARSGREVLRIAQPTEGRNAGSIAFNPGAKPGDADYGLLYIGLGDGGPASSVEAQDRRSPLGKILRIDPDPGRASPGYRVPTGNPYAKPGSVAALPEVWALGLRAPGRMAWNQGSSARMFIPDAGEVIQEINLGEAGRNYGWSERDGTFAVDPGQPGRVLPLPRDEAARGLAFPVLQYDGDEGMEIVGGEVYRGRGVPALAGKYVFADAASGRIFVAIADGLRQGQLGELEEVGVLHNGLVGPLLRLLGGDDRADIQIGSDEARELYIVSGRDGVIRKVLPDPLTAAAP